MTMTGDPIPLVYTDPWKYYDGITAWFKHSFVEIEGTKEQQRRIEYIDRLYTVLAELLHNHRRSYEVARFYHSDRFLPTCVQKLREDRDEPAMSEEQKQRFSYLYDYFEFLVYTKTYAQVKKTVAIRL